MQRKCSRSSVHINSWPCGYVPNYLLHISLILTHATLASLENGDFKKKKKNNWRIVYSALANVLHSSILSPVWKPRAGVQFVVVFSPPLPHFALVTRSVFVCFRIWICGCVHRKASCRLPFVISRFLTPCDLRSGSAHGAVLTCPQAGATHTTVCTYAGEKKSKHKVSEGVGNVKLRQTNMVERRPKKCCRHHDCLSVLFMIIKAFSR